MAASIYPDQIGVGLVETYRIVSTQPGQVFAVTTDNPLAHVEPVAASDGTRFLFYADGPGDFTVTAIGDLGDVAQLVLHVAELPTDLVQMERDLARAIRDVAAGVPYMGQVYSVERYPESGDEDESLTTVSDPVAPGIRLTNYLEIGIPSVRVVEKSGGGYSAGCILLTLGYPLSYTLGVKDVWAKDGFPYTSSGEMFIALFLLTMRALALKRTLGFTNVWCGLLQQESVGTLANEEGEALSHVADWSLTVDVTRPI